MKKRERIEMLEAQVSGLAGAVKRLQDENHELWAFLEDTPQGQQDRLKDRREAMGLALKARDACERTILFGGFPHETFAPAGPSHE